MNGTQVVVEIDDQGEIKVDAVGFRGGACRQATEAIERALGLATGDKVKPEMYAAAPVVAQAKAGGR